MNLASYQRPEHEEEEKYWSLNWHSTGLYNPQIKFLKDGSNAVLIGLCIILSCLVGVDGDSISMVFEKNLDHIAIK